MRRHIRHHRVDVEAIHARRRVIDDAPGRPPRVTEHVLAIFTLHEVHALVRPGGRVPAGAVIVEADLAGAWSPKKLPAGLDSVVHLAQSRWFREFPAQANDVFDVNFKATFKLLEYARQAKIQRVVFASSGGVYGFSQKLLTEEHAVSPPDFYLRSKYAGELLLESYRSLFTTIVLRPFFVYGAGQKSNMLMARLARNILRGEAVKLSGADGLALNPIHVSDAAGAIAKAVELPEHALVNIAGKEVLSLRQVTEIMGRHLAIDPLFEVDEKPAPDRMVAGIERMRELLLTPRTSFQEGVAEVCREALIDR
mgnify:CR=1 FL=1